MLTVDNIGLNLGDRVLLKDISFQIGSGEKVGLVGVNGAGKTTLFKILAGQSLPDTGMVFLPTSVGFLPQEPRVAFRPEQTALECFLEARGLLQLTREMEMTSREVSHA